VNNLIGGKISEKYTFDGFTNVHASPPGMRAKWGFKDNNAIIRTVSDIVTEFLSEFVTAS